MVMSCSAYGCTNRFHKDKNISFVSFPNDPILLKNWLAAMKREAFCPGKSARLCSAHFLPEDFVVNFGRKTLKQGATPSIFDFPKHLMKKPKKERSQRLKNLVGDNKILKPSTSTANNEANQTPKPSTSTSHSVDHAVECQDSTSGVLQDNLGTNTTGSTVSQSVIRLGKRKRSVPVYMGDTKPEDIRSPRTRRMWQIADKAIKRQRTTIKYLRTKLGRSQKKVKTLSDLVTHLRHANKVTPECYSILQDCLPNAEKKLLLRQLKLSSEKKFSPDLRAFALTLHFYSASAYNYVRKQFGNCLPHPSTIRKWYSSIDGSPGYTSEAFTAIKIKAQELKSQGKELVCSLIMDEMSIRQHVDWQGGRNIGYINFGVNLDNDSLPLAREALVFLLVGVNCQWKVPIGYFLINSITASEKATLVKGCCKMLYDAGIRLISLTFDGAATNLSMALVLGANLNFPTLKPYFEHPITNEPIFLILDPCHMLKLLRNALGDLGTFVDGKNNVISWQFFRELVTLQEEQGLHLGNKLRRRHINYGNEKMKVRLAAQVFSSSVADALEYCCSDLKLSNFLKSEGTVTFCRTIDKLFDILNTRNSLSKNPYRKSLSANNLNFVKSFFLRAREYLMNLKNSEGELMINSKRKTGFIGFIVNMGSILGIIETYVLEKKYLSYLLTYKLSQDHIETFFCAIRARGGFNNNPTSAQFESAYKRLLIHAEIASSSSANCLPQDNTSILHVVSTSKKSVDHLLDNISDPNDFDYTDLDVSEVSMQFRNDVVEYVAGFVVRKLKKQLHCEKCSTHLTESESSSFVERKDRGGLIKPSRYVTYICRTAENIFRQNNNFSGNVVLRLTLITKRNINIGGIFPALNDHILDQDPLNNHILQLVDMVLKCYFMIRVNHENKSINEIKERIRHKYSKLILFKNQ